MEANDRLIIEFFDATGVSSTASNVSILLHPGGVAGNVVIAIDDGAPGTPVSATPGTAIDIGPAAVHKVDVQVPSMDTASLYWQGLAFDHDCL